MNLVPYVVSWAVLAVIVIILAIYRSSLASKEDATIHIAGAGTAMVGEQVAMNKRLVVVDLVGKTLTVIVLVAGLALAGLYVYNVWQTSW